MFWEVIRDDYFKMIQTPIEKRLIPKGVAKGIFTFIHKAIEVNDLFNWKPITLLNVMHKRYAKALQYKLINFDGNHSS
jgi:hypothetical protein